MKRWLRILVVVGCATTLAHAAASTSPVADAAMRGDREAVRNLLKQGADVGAARGDGMTALHFAAERGDAETAEMLLYAGANVAAVTRIGQYTPLHLAAQAGSGSVVRGLLEAGADVNARTTTTSVTPMHLAAAAGSVDVINALAEKGGDVNAKEAEWGQTPLMFAAAQNRADAVKTLLAHTADPKVASKSIDVAHELQMDRAAGQLQRKILDASVQKGQNPTPSQVQGAYEAARQLYRTGKVPPREPTTAPDDPNAPQVSAANNFDPEEINPPVAFKGGLTALLHAARQGHVDAARALVDGGAPIDQAGSGDGVTPLLMAAINGQFDMAMF